MPIVPAVKHQASQPFPKVDAPLVDSSGRVTQAWYRLIVSMWNKLGKSITLDVLAIVFQETQDDSHDINVQEAWDGDLLGKLEFSANAAGPVQVQVLGASPFTFVAPQSGMLAVASGAVSVSRDGGVTFYSCGAAGGSPSLAKADQVQVTWSGGAPQVVFFPRTT